MERIVYFVEDGSRKCAVRFVKKFCRRRWFWKEQIWYSYSLSEASVFDDNDELARVCKRVKKDFPDGKIWCVERGEFEERYRMKKFWAIVRWNEKGREEFYTGSELCGKASYSEDVSDADIFLAESGVQDTLRTIQQTTHDKVAVRALHLTLQNVMLTPVFMISCTSKGSQVTKFFKKLDGNRVRMVGTSEAATKFTYEEVLERFAYLQQHNKNFLFAVLPAFKDNVSARDIERYMKENKVSRMLVMDLQLKHLNR